MSTRREFLTWASATVVATATAEAVCIENNASARLDQRRGYKVARRDETTLRLGGDGDNFHMSWAGDDRQLVAVCDGTGWIANPKNLYNSRLFAISGHPHDATFHDVPAYPEKPVWPRSVAYHGFGTLAIDGYIYQFLSSLFRGVKLIYSPDNGRTWCNQDGSTPVVWESRELQSRKTMVFFEEPNHALSLLTVLQMGRNYEANRDGYIYVYAPNGTSDGTMNELVMFRVRKAQLLNRSAYEYFGGLRTDDGATWVRDIGWRAPVHTFPRGWVNTQLSWHHPYAWHPSVVYNAPLGLYMMANWGMGCAPDGDWFAKPSYLGFWIAANPWGPWEQIHEETAWMPNGDRAARAYQPQIAPKWIAADGKSFWLVWTDFQHTNEFDQVLKQAMSSSNHDEFMRLMSQSRQYRPYYAFNTQRVDLLNT